MFGLNTINQQLITYFVLEFNPREWQEEKKSISRRVTAEQPAVEIGFIYLIELLISAREVCGSMSTGDSHGAHAHKHFHA